MITFNYGRPGHGSSDVEHGKLQGSTAETDHFYFFCPKCPDKYILRILDYSDIAEQGAHPHKERVTKKAKRTFALVFQLYCENCQFTDFVKISNAGWQGGTYAKVMSRFDSLGRPG